MKTWCELSEDEKICFFNKLERWMTNHTLKVSPWELDAKGRAVSVEKFFNQYGKVIINSVKTC